MEKHPIEIKLKVFFCVFLRKMYYWIHAEQDLIWGPDVNNTNQSYALCYVLWCPHVSVMCGSTVWTSLSTSQLTGIHIKHCRGHKGSRHLVLLLNESQSTAFVQTWAYSSHSVGQDIPQSRQYLQTRQLLKLVMICRTGN